MPDRLLTPESRLKAWKAMLVFVPLVSLVGSYWTGYVGRVRADADTINNLKTVMSDVQEIKQEIKKENDYNREQYVGYREYTNTMKSHTDQLDRIEGKIDSIQQRR